ncbi:MAG: DUF479 domain-containing protein [Oceanospirillaceae bacterium]|nr:DUF479 domain-containing protein [Oceanospirillaceae bacterium]
MNYLAHLYFAQATIPSRVGNLLGDFARGLDTEVLPDGIHRGLRNHRAIDHYTDSHPDVRQLKALFSPQRRRYSGIVLDVVFDHFLIRHWHTFSDRSLDHFLASAYNDLEQGYPLMPAHMQRVVKRMIEGDWIRSYSDLEQVGFALDRIAERIRFQNRFGGAIVEVERHYSELDEGFLTFFPDLIDFTSENNPETQANL